MMSTKIQMRLRDATHTFHESINQHPLLVGLSGQDCQLHTYQTVLTAYFHLYEKLESVICEFTSFHSVQFDYLSRTKLSWINDDLRYFQIDPQIEMNRPGFPITIPRIESVGQLIGMLYPVEGATLGGQYVFKTLKEKLNLTTRKGAKFFNGYAENTSGRWNEFCHFADSIQDDECQYIVAETTAKLIFALFENVLDDFYRSNITVCP